MGKKVLCCLAAWVLILSLAGCSLGLGILGLSREDGEALLSGLLPTQETIPQWQLTEPTVAVTEPVYIPPAPTEPEHTEFYIPGVTVEDVITYFNEVCLDAEFVHGGNATLLQKWAEPIRYQINGDPTQEDLAVVESFARWLNTIQGFPGIYESQDPLEVNLQIYFCSQEEMVERMGQQYSGMDGGVTFWYSDNRIYDATICIRSDMDQYLRNSVILEEIYNGLGPVQDTALRPDSIIYSEFSEPQQLTDIDELLLKLLYDPRLDYGMDAQQCEEVIRRLYH